MNKNIFSNSRWIWYTENVIKDSYGDFKDTFSYEGGKVLCRFSCDGEYTLYVNGTYVSSNQYADYEHYKVYDELDITEYLKPGQNELYALVWYMGVPSSRYCPGKAGLLYEVVKDDAVLAASGEKTLCRQNPNYLAGYEKRITVQLGCSFLYDATADDSVPYGPALVVDKLCSMYPRPIDYLVLKAPAETVNVIAEPCHYLIDCGREMLGVPTLKFRSDCKQKILVAWGEHIKDGCVRREIVGRDFSFEYVAKEGLNEYTNYMLRLGMRYLEVFTEQPIEIEYIGVIPQEYPVNILPKKFDDPLDQQIYDVCVRTLVCCMMEHYMDTPWREQALYAFDSRNQMLAGYKAFENGNSQYARANLELMGRAAAREGLLPLTHPRKGGTVIPTFSLHYITAVREYLDFTGDLAFGEQVYDRMHSIMEFFMGQMENGLLYLPHEPHHWNFYDWTESMNNDVPLQEHKTDLMINCLFLIALRNMEHIAGLLGKVFPCDSLYETLRKNTHEAFFNKEKGLYAQAYKGKNFTELGNAIAVLSGLAEESEYPAIEKALKSDDLEEASLSVKCFKYDALLKIREENRAFILAEVRRVYKAMLDEGATSVWEVIGGADAFGLAGSLCHAWSSMPICYM